MQGCDRLRFFGLIRFWLIWQSRRLNSDSTQIPNLLTWLNSDSTQNPNLPTWLNSDSTHLSHSWVTSDSRLITFYLIWEKVVDRGGGVRSNVAVGWFCLCKVTYNCKILTFSPRKIIDSTLTQAISSWLNSDSNDDQHDSTLTRLISLIFTADSTLTRLIWVRVESNLTHDSWVEHNPGSMWSYSYHDHVTLGDERRAVTQFTERRWLRQATIQSCPRWTMGRRRADRET